MAGGGFRTVAVVGAGTMGLGIAELCAVAGAWVLVQDAAPDFAETGLARLAALVEARVVRGKLDRDGAMAAMSRVRLISGIDGLGEADLVIEAVPEALQLKRRVFEAIEAVVAPDAVIATNTSSLSVTAIAASARHPGRIAGLHFFNPVAAMKLVEVIPGEATAPGLPARLAEFVRGVGHVPVLAADTPGFIVNHVGRAFTTEALAILSEGVAAVPVIDRILREGAGFRMGPFQLLDTTGLDVSHPVMESIFGQFYGEPRFRPSPLTARRLAGGLLGRKTGRGFYGNGETAAEAPPPGALPASVRVLDGPGAEAVAKLARTAGVSLAKTAEVVLMPLVGDDATTRAVDAGVDPACALGFDGVFGLQSHRTLVETIRTAPAARDAALALMTSDGVPASAVADSVGAICQRVLVVMANIAFEAVQQGVTSAADLDLAARLGLGYPKGPVAWAEETGLPLMLRISERMQALTGDPRYRPSPRLRRAALAGAPASS